MRDNDKGFTLLEVLAAMMLLTLIFALVLRFNHQGMLAFAEAKSRTDISQNVLISFREMEKQIKDSEAILFPPPGSSSNQLWLKQGPAVLKIFHVPPSQLRLEKNMGQNPISYGINQITFDVSDNGGAVEIVVRTTETGSAEKVYRGAVTLRR
jgi:prepilin-type N-terminal cleavage/methylation domain-containing protein